MDKKFPTYNAAAAYLSRMLVADQRAGWCVNRTLDTIVTIGEIEGSAADLDPDLMFRITRRLEQRPGHWVVIESRI